MRKWLMAGLTALLLTSLTSCGEDAEEAPTATATTAAAVCEPDDLDKGVISSFNVEVLSEGQAKATFVLTKDAETGILVHRLRLVGRVPFGPQRAQVTNEETFDLPQEDGKPLEPGEYKLTLRAFEPGKLNSGEPIDTKSACVTLG